MSELRVIRNDEQIANEILFYVEDTRKKILYNAIEIGRRLVEAKEIVGRGEWQKWLEEKVSFKKSTANNFIKIFEEYGSDQLSLLGDNLKVQTFGNISYSQAIELIALEEEERVDFVETHDMEDISVRELRKEIAELKRKSKEEIESIEERNKREKEQLLKDRDKAYLDIAAIAEEKRIAEETFNDEAEERLLLEKKVQDLEQEIKEVKNKPLEIDVKRKDFEREAQEKINALKREKEEILTKLELQKLNSNEYVAKYRVHFENLNSEFRKILVILEEMKINDVDHIKFKGTTETLISAMLKKL